MTAEEHLRDMWGPLIWDLTVKLASTRADLDNLNELIKALQTELAQLKDKGA
jgi:hypothetical protein